MENFEAVKPITMESDLNTKESEIEETKEYELNLDKDIYKLEMESYKDQKMIFKIRQSNNISFCYYHNTFEYNYLIKEFILPAQHYENITKLYKFFDSAFSKNKFILSQDKDKKELILSIKLTVGFDEIESKLHLKETKFTNEEMIIILFKEIKEIKIKGIPNTNNENKDELINNLVKKNEEMETKINLLVDENKTMKEILNKYQDFLEKKIEEEKKEKELNEKAKEEYTNFVKQNINQPFKENPQNLKVRDYLTTNYCCSQQFSKIAVYTGLKDHVEYLVYDNKKNHNLDIMRIIDKTIITSLQGHSSPIPVIKYYTKNNNEEYLLSCDESKLVIIWDIQNYYNKKYTIQTNYSGIIADSLLLFNIFNNDYILLSNTGSNEFSKLYYFKQNTPFIRNINGTNQNPSYFIIPWLYNNKYYIIDCGDSVISINNMLEDETYANLKFDPESQHYGGYLYNDNYLCVSHYYNKFIRIWDLVNKVIYKQINYDDPGYGYEIIQWNNQYSIVGDDKVSFVIIDIEEGKMVKRIQIKNIVSELRGLKKIKLGQLGECLIGSDKEGNISLMGL